MKTTANFSPGGIHTMKILVPFLFVATICFAGCVNMISPQTDTASRTNVALVKYKRLAVIKFHNPANEQSGQEAADILSLGFVKQGFNVVGSSQLASLIDQNEINESGLTPEIRARLKSDGIDSIVSGTINEYSCSGAEKTPLYVKVEDDNRCSVTVTAKMLDLETGELVWGTTVSDMQEGKRASEDSVLRAIMHNIQTTIPNITTLKRITSTPRKMQ
jgi:curli biogenesis system outer membrane secretion channel CsgG